MTLLIILLIASVLIVGFFTRQQAFRKLGRVLIMAAFIPFFINLSKNVFSQLPLEQKIIIAIIVTAVGSFALLRILLGKSVFNNLIGNYVYDGLKAVFTFPFKIISGMMRKYK